MSTTTEKLERLQSDVRIRTNQSRQIKLFPSNLMRDRKRAAATSLPRRDGITSGLFFRLVPIIIFLQSFECSSIATSNQGAFPTDYPHLSQTTTATTTSRDNAISEEDRILLVRVKHYWECKIEQREHDNRLLRQTAEEAAESPRTCPVTFDGWVCWEAAEAGSHSVVTCPPSYFQNENESVRSAIRYCNANATWQESVESESGEDAPVAHPCSPTHAESLRDDNVFGMVIAATSEIEIDFAPYADYTIAATYEACVLSTLSKPPSIGHGVSYCPRTFDRWSCWNDTLAGEIASVNCPSFVSIGFDSKRLAHKVCNEDGNWFRHPQSKMIWSNYTTCVDTEDLQFRHQINNLYITGYSVSVTALIISMVIFFVFNSLKCGRVTIHKNLFTSFIVNNVLWIIWYTAVLPYPEVLKSNPATCQVLHVVLQYFLVCTYFWMFCEGLYLHTLLVLAFVSEPRIMRLLYVIGWGVPSILITVYASVRMSNTKATEYCCMEEHGSTWILSVPVGVSMFLNLAFLINIVRVLVTKLRAVNSPDNHHTRKAARATLILIPLLGLHYVIVPFRPEPGSHGEKIYQTTAAIATSFQGFCVALLFCFFNGEVIALVRKRWKQEIMMRQKDRRTSYAATTVSEWDGQDTSL